MKKLADLFSPFCINGLPDVIISGLNNDSRLIKPGDLFLAYPGSHADGRFYCQQAVVRGAVAIAFDPANLSDSFIPSKDLTMIPVPQLAQKLALIASRFYDLPSQDLTVVGVTGTNGKTTIAWLLAKAQSALGLQSAYIGTLGYGDAAALRPLSNTTPDALCLQALLADYKQQGTECVNMEVSSHALIQGRTACIDFNQAIYTNLSHDHLDYHVTMQAYAEAKALLFSTPSLKYAILNHDDQYTELMASQLPNACQKLTYGLHEEADVRATNIQISMTGSAFDIDSPWGHHHIKTKTLGQFNVYNSLAVYTSLMAQGHEVCDVIHVLAQLPASPGRMELVCDEPCVIVDYAHTPDALENVLSTLSVLKQGQLWVVIGCGGDRDKAKRPMMGRIASQYADRVIITSDNPRSESPEQIAKEMEAGLLFAHIASTIIDREQAIHYALSHANRQDIVLIAGKGHESYQHIGNQRFVFSDQEVVNSFNCHRS